MHQRNTTWSAVLERALLTGCAAWMLLQSLNTVMALASGPEGTTVPALTAALLGRLTLIGLCVYGARSGISRTLVIAGLVAGAVAVAGAGVASLDPELSRTARLMLPTDALQAVQIFAVATAVQFRRALLIILATFPIHLAVRAPGGITGDTLEQWITPTSATVALAALVVYLRSGSVYAEQLDAWNRNARQQATATAAHETARAEARRVIHDDVISALRGIEHDVATSSRDTASRTALTALAQHRDITTANELLDSLATDSPVQLERNGTWPASPPPRVLDAFRGAASEALRNVARHSGVDRASLAAYRHGDELTLVVRDRGRGIEAGRTPGFGLSTSITSRMEEVGGSAEIEGTPDRGTAVTLRWRPPPSPPTEQLTPYASDQRWRGYLPVALAITANSSFLAWRHPGEHLVLGLALAAFLAVLLPVTAWWFATRPPAPRDSVVVAVVVASITWFGLEIAGPGGLTDMRSWVVGFAGSLTMLLAFDARPRHVLIPVAAQVGICLWVAADDPTIGAFEPIGALTTPIVISGFSCLFGALLRRGTKIIRRGEAILAARLEAQAWQEAQDAARRVHLETLREDVAPLLRRVLETGAGGAEQREAARLSARCRDELMLPRPLPDDVRRAVDRARDQGATVTFRVSGHQDEAWPAALDQTLERLLHHSTPAVVTVLAGASPRVVAIPALPRTTLTRLLRDVGDRVRVSGDDVRTVLELSSDGSSGARPAEPVPMTT